MFRKKKNQTPEVNRIKVIPMVLLSVFLASFVAFMLKGQHTQITEYLTTSKTREAHLKIETLENDLEASNISSLQELEDLYKKFQDIDNTFIGITVKKNDTTVASVGSPLPEQLFERAIDPRMVKFVVNSNQYLMTMDSKEGNNSLYLGMKSNFNMDYALMPLASSGGMQSLANMATMENRVQGYQDFWFYYYIDDYVVYIGDSVPLSDLDYQLIYLFNLGFGLMVFLVILILVLVLTRVFISQYRIIKTYYTDNVTREKNWYYFNEILTKKRKRLYKNNNQVAIVFLGMEKFHNYYTYYGEAESKQILLDVSNTIKENLPKKSYFARFEACSFGLCISYRRDEEINDIVDKILNALSKIRPASNIHFYTGAYNLAANDSIRITDAFNNASLVAKLHRDSTDGQLHFFTTALASDLLWEQEVNESFARAIANEEFEVYLQPKYNVSTRTPVAAEALVRWNHPTEGFLTPYRFIPILEKNGLILELDDYMVTKIAQLQAQYLKEGKPTYPISVNLSRGHFIVDKLADHICKLVDEYDVPHELIEIELTESSFFDNKKIIIETANQLREYGFSVSLDDFGTGYSSLNSLLEIPINILKLDQGFFRGHDLSDKSGIIIKDIISLAHNLNLDIVAEGIEEEEQVDFLAELDCTMIQGYYFAKPMSISDYNKLVYDEKSQSN